MVEYRKTRCEGCAFNEDSPEMGEERRNDFLLSLCMGDFYCHKTMYVLDAGKDKYHGIYDPNRDVNGNPCDFSKHQVCAGHVERMGDEFFEMNGMEIPK